MIDDACFEPRNLVEQWIDAYWRTGDLPMDRDDCPFAGGIFKIAEGVGYLDGNSRLDWALRQVAACQAGGRKWQYYMFSRPDLRPELDGARLEAEAMAEALELVPDPHLVRYADGSIATIWVDLERDSGVSQASTFDWLITLLELLESAGQYCGLYSGRSWFETNTSTNDRVMRALFTRQDGSFRPLWCARYGKNTGEYPPDLTEYPIASKKSPNWYLVNRGAPVVQQWTSKRITPGIEAGHDSNLVYLAP
jgi:hypothetical protein